MRDRVIAILALAIPGLAGLGYLWAFDAPRSYLAINAGALIVAVLAIVFRPRHLSTLARRGLIALALLLLFVPLATGPSLGEVERWVPIGPFMLNAGLFVMPALSVLLGRETEYAPSLTGVAVLAALLQPDLALGAALTVMTLGLYDATKDWRYGIVVVVAFTASLVAATQGELPAQPYADRVIFLLARTDLLAALGLAASLLASFVLILAGAGCEPARKALAGALFGFTFAGHVSNYPSPLVGYGPTAIVGFGLALALLNMSGSQKAAPEPPPR